MGAEAIFDNSKYLNYEKNNLSGSDYREDHDPFITNHKNNKILCNELSSERNSSSFISISMKILVTLSAIATLSCVIFTSHIIFRDTRSPIVISPESSKSEGIIDDVILKIAKRDIAGEFQSEISTIYSTRDSDYSLARRCINISEVLRFDCHPQAGASQTACEARGCCWNPQRESNPDPRENDIKKLNVPNCYYPENWQSYEYTQANRSGNDFSGILNLRTNSSFYKNDIPRIRIRSTSLSDSILRVKIDDPENDRWEPQWPDKSLWQITSGNNTPKYIFQTDTTRFGFAVKRSADNTILFDSTGIGGFTFADQFLQIHSILPSHYIYGLGEHRSRFKLNTNWQSFTMFNRAKIPVEESNLYGSHPFYYVIEESGDCHGVLFLNSNAMDAILQPAPAITFRTIGGIFDIYFFMGPKPEDVLRQYSEIVGKPYFPPYWGLGFHLSKYGYRTLEKTKEVWNRTRNAGIPYDVQWNDIDYLDQNNAFTLNKNDFKDLPKFLDELHSIGMYYVPMIYAGVTAGIEDGAYPPYDEGIRDNIFIKDAATNEPFIGRVEDIIPTVWPDFSNPNTTDYYYRMLRELHNKFPYDGAWIDMNEPVNDNDGMKGGCPANDLDYPQYLPNVDGGLLATQTLCMNAKHHLGPHYDLHNTYAIEQAVATRLALPKIVNKRPFIISRATWVGLGHYSGHFTGDEYSTWHDMKMSIPNLLSHSLFQIPFTGTDICGFNGNTTQALCNRWVQLGAFYPFARNHNCNNTIEQDPVAMGEFVANSTRKSLLIRYRLLPYLYTLFHRAHKFGDTVARPLFFEFIDDRNTYGVDTHFLWGSSLLIVPVLEEGETEVTAYIPRGIWYDYYNNDSIVSSGEYITFDAPLDKIPLLVRGGSILACQRAGVTTSLSRKNKFELIVALNENYTASGELYWDDGDSIDSAGSKQFKWLEFNVRNEILNVREIEKGYFGGDMVLGEVHVLGIRKTDLSRVSLHQNSVTSFQSFHHAVNSTSSGYLNIPNLNVDLKSDFTLSWEYSPDDSK